ncbi:hypothetical protein AGMMS49592_4860 [Endomicrobiia bacterium]|nr:hypothetical protein AGMMS49592_4860 [Endomicrobiia bacterium]
MPMGVHFMGTRFSDAKTFQVAHAFEKISDFDMDKYPTIVN